MSSKVPCGGFKLDNNFFGMNENVELSLSGGSEGEGKAYKQLVTDGDGKATWEDRLAYEGSKVVVGPLNDGTSLAKVADEIPGFVSAGEVVNIYLSTGEELRGEIGDLDFNPDVSSSVPYAADVWVVFITENNQTTYLNDNLLTFPQKGVYFSFLEGTFYVSGFSRSTSDAPEITWDGSLYTIKQIDEKFIPSTNPNISKNYRVVFEETSRNVFQCNCTYSELKDFAVAGYPIYGVLLDRTAPTNTYQYNLIMVRNNVDGNRMEFEFATGEGGNKRLYYHKDGSISNEAPIG